MAKKSAQDPASQRAALEQAILSALQPGLDGSPRPLRGTPASGAFFSGGVKGAPLAEAALAKQFLEIVANFVPPNTPRGRSAPPTYARLTDTGREWVVAQSSPLVVAHALRDILASQGAAIKATVEEAQGELAVLSQSILRLQAALKEQVDRYHQSARSLSQLLSDAKQEPVAHSPVTSVWHDDLIQLVHAHKQRNSLTRPTLPQLYDELKKKYPDLTLAQYHDGLRILHLDRRLLLGPFTQSLAILPDHLNALYLDKEVKFYVDLP